ncbi:homocysteine S-methyltransferase [Lysobacter korlensis]|uniref:Homocysteine S-methyltransferase n=1 Tax=Lysobacter korlensis TaxID=553636 RepID=A0ABV6RMN4_9GAMM
MPFRVPSVPIVLDGGLGTLLESRGHDLSSDMWSARLLLQQPDEVRAAHDEFFAAGAQLAISGSYQASFEGFAREGLDRDQAERVMRLSIRIATEARDAAAADGAGPDGRWVAASVGPYGAMLADGSEYRGDYRVGERELREWHAPRMAVLADAQPDLLAVETIPSLSEVRAVLDVLSGSGVPAWVSVTPHLGALRTAEPLESAFAAADGIDEIIAVGVNCCSPSEVLGAIAAARRATDKPIVVYPNSGELWDAKNRTWVGEPGFPRDLVERWLDAGAWIIGGCCRVGPAQISRIASVLHRHPVQPSLGSTT